jgi:hypothetical protein
MRRESSKPSGAEYVGWSSMSRKSSMPRGSSILRGSSMPRVSVIKGLTYVKLFFNSEPETQLSLISCEDAIFSPVMLLPISMLLALACNPPGHAAPP